LLSLIGSPSSALYSDLPKIFAVEPNAGITTPGIKVTVYGDGFTPQTVFYFGGLEVREVKFISPSRTEVVTPYLRPGPYQLHVKSGDIFSGSEATFTALPSPIDAEIDRAAALVKQGQAPAAIAILADIATANGDYQVRAFTHYQTGQIYFGRGDWWRWAGEVSSIYDDADKSGGAVQTYWQYRLAYAQSVYLLPVEGEPEAPLKLANWVVKYDVTQSPEPRFFRGLVNARYGNLANSKADSDFILTLQPDNPSYRALAAYISVLTGGKTLQSSKRESITDARALSLLGQAAYLSGDLGGAQLWWAREAEVYPLGASLAYWAGKKHMSHGQRRVGEALLTESLTMAPDTKEAQEAKELLAVGRPATR
jgi:tetratricopeptide (TPR) repeat protein